MTKFNFISTFKPIKTPTLIPKLKLTKRSLIFIVAIIVSIFSLASFGFIYSNNFQQAFAAFNQPTVQGQVASVQNWTICGYAFQPGQATTGGSTAGNIQILFLLTGQNGSNYLVNGTTVGQSTPAITTTTTNQVNCANVINFPSQNIFTGYLPQLQNGQYTLMTFAATTSTPTAGASTSANSTGLVLVPLNTVVFNVNQQTNANVTSNLGTISDNTNNNQLVIQNPGQNNIGQVPITNPIPSTSSVQIQSTSPVVTNQNLSNNQIINPAQNSGNSINNNINNQTGILRSCYTQMLAQSPNGQYRIPTYKTNAAWIMQIDATGGCLKQVFTVDAQTLHGNDRNYYGSKAQISSLTQCDTNGNCFLILNKIDPKLL